MPTPKRFDSQITVQMPLNWRIQLDALAMLKSQYTGDVIREILRTGIPSAIADLTPEEKVEFERHCEAVQRKYDLKATVKANPEP